MIGIPGHCGWHHGHCVTSRPGGVCESDGCSSVEDPFFRIPRLRLCTSPCQGLRTAQYSVILDSASRRSIDFLLGISYILLHYYWFCIVFASLCCEKNDNLWILWHYILANLWRPASLLIVLWQAIWPTCWLRRIQIGYTLCHLKEMWIGSFGALFLCFLRFFQACRDGPLAWILGVNVFSEATVVLLRKHLPYIVRIPQKCCSGMQSVFLGGFKLF